MNIIKTIVKFELMRYFLSPLAYVFLVCFLLLSGSCAIYFGHFFGNGQANLFSLFDYLPWVFLLFIPGIAMKSWAEEFKSRSIVQTLTLPISIHSLIIGKFLASLLFILIALVLTFPFWITINVLGNPDNVVVFIGYLSCFILAGAMLSISQTMSAITKSPIIALVLSVFVNLLFFWSGFEYVLFWARQLFNDTLVDVIISFSFLSHFTNMSRGLIELSDIVFFATLIIFFNALSIMIISLRTKGASNLLSLSSKKHAFVVFVLLFICFFAINIISNNLFRRINYDFTEEKHLSLTKNTKDILAKLNRPVVAKLYYSPILEKRNPNIRIVFDRIKLMLKQYKAYGNGNFDYKIYNPTFLDKIEDRALSEGLQPIPVVDLNINALFGISFSDTLTNKSVIPFFSFDCLSYLEQDLTTHIYKLQNKKKNLGILSSLPVFGINDVGGFTIKEWEFVKQIKDYYNVTEINSIDDFNKNFDVFMLIHPYNLDSEMVKNIKKQQKVLVLLDAADEASLLYSPNGGLYISSDLSDLANYWGIDFYYNKVVADFDNSILVDDTINYSKNPSFNQDLLQFEVKENNFNPNHRISHKLHNILFSSASIVMPKNEANILFYPLIRASGVSSLMDVNFVKKRKTPREILENFTPKNDPLIIAAEFLSNNPLNDFDVIAIADTDFIYDKFWAKELSFLDKTYSTPLFDSNNFVLNALDYLTGNDDLIALRGKKAKNRLLNKVEIMRKNNTYKYKLKETDILNAISGVKQGLNELIAKKEFEGRVNFTPDELAIIGNIRKNIDSLRMELSDIRNNAHDNIRKLDEKVKFFNIYFISILIVILSLFFVLKNLSFKNQSVLNDKSLDKSIKKFGLWTILVCCIALITIYFDNRNSITSYEDILVFKNLHSKINDISKLEIKNSKNSLIFIKKDDIWQLENCENCSVYQKRLLSFLLTISNMTYYEKKSNKVEDLKYFGFSSLKNENSPTTEVSIFNGDGELMEKFDIGWYNIDIGRGAKAAFIKKLSEFQVWLVGADFYDLSLDKKYWTYSSLWDLRFGRFIKYNNVTEESKIMNIVKNLLNIYFTNIVEDVDAKEIGKIHILSENNNDFDLVFYKSSDDKFYVKYNFIKEPFGENFVFFARNTKNKYLEISKNDWEILKNDVNTK